MHTTFCKITKVLEHYFQTGLDNQFLKKHASKIAGLSSYFVSRGGKSFSESNYMSWKPYREAYILYYLPVNIFKITFLLKKCITSDYFKGNKISILDVGSGPGTAGLAAITYLSFMDHPPSEIIITSVDKSAEILRENERLLALAQNVFATNLRIIQKTIKHDISKSLKSKIKKVPYKFDLIFLCNILGELSWEKSIQSVLHKDICRDLLSPTGYGFFVEPAQKIFSRRLLEIRNRFARDPQFNIVYPCPEILQCPALDPGGKDWCHNTIPWKNLSHIEKLDKMTGLRKDRLKFSNLVISRNNENLKSILSSYPSQKASGIKEKCCINEGFNQTLWVVISDPIKERGKISFFLCGNKGRFRFELLKKHKSKSNALFFEIKRGSEVIISGAALKNKIFRLDNYSIVKHQ